MPEKKSFTVEAKAVKAGDFVQDYGPVEVRDSKVKWTTLYFDKVDSLKLRLLNDAEITVVREVPTAEEQHAKEVRRTLLSLDVKAAQARGTLQAARDKMIKSLEAGERASYWSWMDVPALEALVELWDAADHVHQFRAQSDEPLTRVEAVRAVLGKRTEDALQYYRALSRSTSTVSNLFDDIKLEALSSWRRELEWIIVPL